YKNLQFGNSSGTYNIKTLTTALKRMELCGALFLTQPGPKMIWQFGELGYDYTINFCQNGTINTNCRTDPKPISWSYFQNSGRNQLYHVWAGLLQLRQNPIYRPLFVSNNITRDFSGAFKWLKLSVGATHLATIGNFDVVQTTGSITFPTAGTWYDYLTGTTITATGSAQSFTLAPGEYHVFTNQFVALPVTLTSFNGKNNGKSNLLFWGVNNEENLGSYDLQRSLNAQDFETVANVTATGNSNYNYTDDISGIIAPAYFYRLKMVDKDGNYKYSPVVKITVSVNGGFIEVNPNPFKEILNVNIESTIKDVAAISISDMSGRLLLKKSVAVSAGNNAFEIKEAAGLARGMYVMTIKTSQQKQSIKIVKGK
ncbi:MAG: T9SS type A sorting domain-containing protein, partial [Ferruginibacter sp.]